jgi:hypothetical protein
MPPMVRAAIVAAVLAGVWLQAHGTFKAPRTPWGDPDLQGIWPSAVLVDVPFERPASFGTRDQLTDEEFAQAQRRAERWRAIAAETYVHEEPGDFTPYDRCITRGVLGSMFPNIYNTGTEILQGPGVVAIRHEMIHETRLVPPDPSTLPQGQGRPPTAALQLVERFTLTPISRALTALRLFPDRP